MFVGFHRSSSEKKSEQFLQAHLYYCNCKHTQDNEVFCFFFGGGGGGLVKRIKAFLLTILALWLHTVSAIRNLGVNFDKAFKSDNQINAVISFLIFFTLRLIFKVSSYVTTKDFEKVIHALV